MSSQVIRGVDNAPARYRPEILQAAARAYSAGARGPLDYVGIGMWGIVFCDPEGHAWKIFRLGSEPLRPDHRLFLEEILTDEYEWLAAAAESSMREHVAHPYGMNPEHLVLERECVPGRAGAWADDAKLHDLHRRIQSVMLPLGWTAPEFKEDSYVEDERTGAWRLVDASSAQRVGETLASYVEDVLDGRRPSRWTPHDLAFFILREKREGTVPAARAKALLDRLVGVDPEIKTAFVLDGARRGTSSRNRGRA